MILSGSRNNFVVISTVCIGLVILYYRTYLGDFTYGQVIVMTAVISVLTWLFGYYKLYYFEVTPSHLVVRNHWRPWIQKNYRLCEIESLQFDNLPSWGDVIIVIVAGKRKVFGTQNMIQSEVDSFTKFLFDEQSKHCK